MKHNKNIKNKRKCTITKNLALQELSNFLAFRAVLNTQVFCGFLFINLYSYDIYLPFIIHLEENKVNIIFFVSKSN